METEESGEVVVVYEWLQGVGLEYLYENFMAHNFHHEETFVQLSMKDFPALGIKTLDERKKLFALIGRVKGGGSPLPNSPASSSPFASPSGATSTSTRYPPQSVSSIKQEPPRRASLPEGNSLARKTQKQAGQGRSSVPGSGLKYLQKAEEEAELDAREEDEDEDLPLTEDKEPPRQPPVLSKRG